MAVFATLGFIDELSTGDVTAALAVVAIELVAFAVIELQRVLEEAVDGLPETYRVVFMLRDVEGLSTTETGAALALGEEAVKTRLHRARAILRRAVALRVGAAASYTFQFHAPRCNRVVAAVMWQLPASVSRS